MKMIVLATSLLVVTATTALAQNTAVTGKAENQTPARSQDKQIYLQSGTQLSAQLEGTLDVRRAKPGDRIVLKITQDIKQDDQVIIRKGSRLTGYVTEVQPRTEANNESRLGVIFDRLRSGSHETAIAASVLSLTSSHTNNPDLDSETMSQTSGVTRSHSSSTNGGLLAGTGKIAGGALNTTASTAGSVASTANGAIGSTVGATTGTTGTVAGPLSGLQITQSSSTTTASSSTLILAGRDLRIESGTTFKLAVSNATSINP